MKKRILSTVVEEVTTSVLEETRGDAKPSSVREVVRTLDRTVSTIHKNVQNILHCYLHKISHVQGLFPSNLKARDNFSLEFLTFMETEKRMAVENFVDW